MRYRVRIQPYVSPEVRRKLRTFAAAQELTDSAVMEAALVQYLEGEHVDQSLVLRRLDKIAEAVDHLQHDVDLLSLAFGRYAWVSFLFAPAEPSDGAGDRAADLYRRLLVSIADRLRSGVRFAVEVGRARADDPPRSPARGAGGGQ